MPYSSISKTYQSVNVPWPKSIPSQATELAFGSLFPGMWRAQTHAMAQTRNLQASSCQAVRLQATRLTSEYRLEQSLPEIHWGHLTLRDASLSSEKLALQREMRQIHNEPEHIKELPGDKPVLRCCGRSWGDNTQARREGGSRQ